MNKYNNLKNKYIAILIVILLIIVIFYTNHNKNIDKKSNTFIATDNKRTYSMTLDKNMLIKDISYMQAEDGGFYSISYAESNTFDFLESTYYSIYTMGLLDNSIPEEQLIKIQDALINFDTRSFMDNYNYNNITMASLYLRLCDLVQVSITEEVKNEIVNYFSNLQACDGFFYSCEKEKDEMSVEDYIQNDMTHLNSITTLEEISYIIKVDVNKFDIEKYVEYLNSFIEKSIVVNNDDTLCNIKSYLNIYTNLDIKLNSDMDQTIANIYYSAMDDICLYETNASIIQAINAISMYINENLVKEDLNKVVDVFWDKEGFIVSQELNMLNIKSTCFVLEVLINNQIMIDENYKTQMMGYIQRHQCFDGSYSFIEKESFIYDTYYATLLIQYLDADALYKDEKLMKHIDTYFKNTFNTASGPIPLLYLKMAYICNYQTDEKSVFQFLENQFGIASSSDYTKNIELIQLLLEVAHLYDYNINTADRSNLCNKIANYVPDDTIMESYIIYQCINYINCYLLDIPVEEKYLSSLIKTYDVNIDKLSSPTHCAKLVIDTLNQYGVQELSFSSGTKYKLKQLVNLNKRHEFFRFDESSALSFFATYDTYCLLDYLD